MKKEKKFKKGRGWITLPVRILLHFPKNNHVDKISPWMKIANFLLTRIFFFF